jgi:hypothetical protein
MRCIVLPGDDVNLQLTKIKTQKKRSNIFWETESDRTDMLLAMLGGFLWGTLIEFCIVFIF